MWSVCYSPNAFVASPPWLICTNKSSYSTKSKYLFSSRGILKASLKDDSSSSIPKQTQMGYDNAEELYGLGVDIPPRDAKSDVSEPRSWFGPNGQYIRELPCPSCRGRGYTPCAECGIERSRKDCSACSGKGIMTCQHCSGECVIWEETIDEIPWEKARSSSPVKVKDDDEVDNLDLKLNVRKKSKRVYRSTPEVGLKISRSLKSLNERTGLFSKRMKLIHQDPALHAQRVTAIKKTKRTDAARKQASEALKIFFSDPENRRRRSVSMKGNTIFWDNGGTGTTLGAHVIKPGKPHTGTKFFCKKCGQEGHRSQYCPEHGKNIDRRLKCGLCGLRGHNRKTCGRPSTPKLRILPQYHCGACGQIGHNRRTCSAKAEPQSVGDLTKNGSSMKAEPQLVANVTKSGSSVKVEPPSDGYLINSGSSVKARPHSVGDVTTNGNSLDSTGHFRMHYRCSVCEKLGHNSRTCSLKGEPQLVGDLATNGNSLDSTGHIRKHYRCSVCEQLGHNSRTCSLKGGPRLVGDLTENGSSAKAEPQLVSDLTKNGGFVKAEPQLVGDLTENASSVKAEPHSVGYLTKNVNPLDDSMGRVRKHYRCSVCEQLGHNSRTCAQKSVGPVDVIVSKKTRRRYHCRNCGVTGHNRSTCLKRAVVNNAANATL